MTVSRRKKYTRNLGRARAERVPVRGAGARYMRFAHKDEPFGVFSYLGDARPWLSETDRDELNALRKWFQAHLEEPDCFVPIRVRRGSVAREGEPTAVCWFHASATEHVTRARRMSVLVRRAGIPIVELRRERIPGQVCSEDGEQLAVASYWED
jgi:hypothetical protein